MNKLGGRSLFFFPLEKKIEEHIRESIQKRKKWGIIGGDPRKELGMKKSM